MRLRNVWVYALGVTLSASLVACGGGGQESSAPATTAAPAAPGASKVDPATAGDVKGTVTLTGAAPKNEPIRMNADPICVKEAKGPQAQETFVVSARRQARQRVRLRQGRTRQLRLRPAVGGRQAGSAWLPLHAARVRRPRRPADRDHQQRPDAPQHPRDAEGQPRVQQRPADPGHEDERTPSRRRK